MFEKLIINHAPRVATLILVLLGTVALSTCLSGCKAVESIADNIGDKAVTGLASYQSVTLESSDAVANGAPAGKVTSMVGKIQSVPVAAKKGEVLKDYWVLTVTDTPGWFDFTSKKREVNLTFTASDSAEFQKIFNLSFQQISGFFTTNTTASK